MMIYSGFTHWKWWFSIVMLVYQRVSTVKLIWWSGFPRPFVKRKPGRAEWNQIQHWYAGRDPAAGGDGYCPEMAVCQNLVPLVNIKIAGKWMFIPLKMVLIGIDPYPNHWSTCTLPFLLERIIKVHIKIYSTQIDIQWYIYIDTQKNTYQYTF